MIEQIPLNYYALSGLFNFIILFALSIFVFSKNPKSRTNQTSSLWTFTVAAWSLFYFLWLSAEKSYQAEFYLRILMLFVIFIPSAFTHFILTFLKLDFNKRINFGNYLISFLLAFTVYTQLFANDIGPFLVFPYWLKPRLFFHIHSIHFFANIIYSHFLMLRSIRHNSGVFKNQILYVFIGTVIGYSAGEMNYLTWYRIPIPPFLNPLVSIYVAFVSYAIVRHQLMDIEVLIKKSLVFAGVFSFVFAVVVAVAMLVAQFLGAANNLLSLVISALIITFAIRPVESWLINATDKFLFQKKYEYKQIIRSFIDGVITELNLDQVINSTLKLLDETLHPYTSSIFILNKAEDKYQLYSAYGLKDKNISFSSDAKLITLLKTTKEPAVIKRIDGIAGVNPEVASELSQLKAVIALPLMLHNDLIGFISLGKKKSDEEYTRDDLDVLQDLARTESIAVGNAQLLTEAAQSERRAAIGTMAAGIHHEIGNPLNIIATRIQLFKLSRQKGLFRHKSNEEVLNQTESTLDECLKQSERISEITRKLSNFAKPSKEFKPELVSVPLEIDEVLAVFGHELEMEKIKIEKKFSQDLPKIVADRREIQQIFFNIIRNAAQAIEEEGVVTVSAAPTTNNRVHIEVQDTGKGIPKDKIQRIFEPFFTTKGSNKGTGLGLSIVRQLVWRNKGEISFKSQEGIGTTFILEFPKGS